MTYEDTNVGKVCSIVHSTRDKLISECKNLVNDYRGSLSWDCSTGIVTLTVTLTAKKGEAK